MAIPLWIVVNPLHRQSKMWALPEAQHAPGKESSTDWWASGSIQIQNENTLFIFKPQVFI